MGMNAGAFLMFGYDLGEPSEWPEEMQDNIGDDEDEEEYLSDLLLERLVGFTEKYYDGIDYNAYSERKDLAENKLNVKVQAYSAVDYPRFALVLKSPFFKGDWSGTTPVNISLMDFTDREPKYKSQLKDAMTALEFPTDKHPGWLLCADWG